MVMAEKKWIDANALIKDKWWLAKFVELSDGRTALTETMNLQDIPTVDVVKVCRCKDCEHCIMYTKTYADNRQEIKYWCTVGKGRAVEVSAEHFCSYGEKEN